MDWWTTQRMPQQSPLASSHKALELPNEIIQLIFSIFATTLLTQRRSQFPWFLGHICSTWRSIFLSMTTEFWSSIWIFLNFKNAERVINVVRFFLKRDPAAPFSFHISLCPQLRDHRRVANRLRQIMEMLVDESMRWKMASFNISAQDVLPLIGARDRLPLLQELILSRQSSYEGIPDLLDVFQNAPSLNVVGIRNLANWKFNWSNLKAVDVYTLGSRASEFVATLPQMKKLERLALDCAYDDAIPPSTIVLPSLTTLHCMLGWLRFIQAPAMEDLLINNEYASTSDSADIVLSFLRRSCCALNILRLGIYLAQASTVIEIIRHMPRIAHLKFWSVDEPGNVFEQLIIPTGPAQEPLARHLLSLFFGDLSKASDDDMSLLFDLISSRTVNRTTGNRNCKKLQKLEISGDIYDVSLLTNANVIELCEERGVQYVGPRPNMPSELMYPMTDVLQSSVNHWLLRI